MDNFSSQQILLGTFYCQVLGQVLVKSNEQDRRSLTELRGKWGEITVKCDERLRKGKIIGTLDQLMKAYQKKECSS